MTTHTTRPWTIRTALVFLLLLLAGGAAGCAGVKGKGATSAEGRPPQATEVRLIVSRDFGATVMHDALVPWREDLSVMTVLAEQAEVETAYGGGFVNSIDGVKSTFSGTPSADAADWFYWVDGIMAGAGAADYKLPKGATIWWDYHTWTDVMSVPTTLSAFPAPWRGHTLPVSADDQWPSAQQWAKASGLTLGEQSGLRGEAPAGSLVLATPKQAAATPWLSARLARKEGIRLVDVETNAISLLSIKGVRGPRAAAAALTLPAENADDRPLLVVLADSPSAADRFFTLLTPKALAGRVGVALIGDELVPLPWKGE